MKIAVLDCHNKNYNDIFQLTKMTRKLYCQKHNYDFISYEFDKLEPSNRTPHWGRVLGIKKHLPDYDWIFYLDTDLLILNYDQTLEELIDESYDFIVGPLQSESHISTSGMIIKNTPFVNDEFLDVWWSQTQFNNAPYIPLKEHWNLATAGDGGGKYFEQSAFQFLYDTNLEYRKKIKRIPRKYFNSIDCNAMFSYKEGDFLIHFPGDPKQTKLQKIRKYLYNRIKIF